MYEVCRRVPLSFKPGFFYSLIVPDVTVAMLMERTIAKKSFWNLTVLFCKTWGTVLSIVLVLT